MAKEMRCGDLVPGCDYVVRGETEEEIMERGGQHAMSAHGFTEKDFTPDVIEQVRSKIRDV